MKHIKTFYDRTKEINKNYITEKTDYYNLHGDDEYEITRTVRDSFHDYEYCDGILYELSENDTIVNVEELEHTPENTFYDDQIERYVEYFEDGGITQTFPVDESPLGYCRNLEEMLEYLEESENFDMCWDLLQKNHKKFYDIDKTDIVLYPNDFGFNDSIKSLEDIRTIEDLNLAYNIDIMDNEDREGDYDEELYKGFVSILKHWEEEKEYTLTDYNHKFAALVKMGKKRVMVEVV